MSKFISGSETIELLHSLCDPSYGDEDMEHRSVITDKRNYIRRKDLVDYQVTVFLFKYADPSAELHLLEQYENTYVKFCPEGDEPVKDVYGDPIDYYIEQIEPFLLGSLSQYGACNVIFKATDGSVEAVVVLLGYGFQYGMNYGGGL